jgi:hypothetical protein
VTDFTIFEWRTTNLDESIKFRDSSMINHDPSRFGIGLTRVFDLDPNLLQTEAFSLC